MGKKASSPVVSASILLAVPEGVPHQTAAKAFLEDQQQKVQPLFFNPEEDTVKISLVRELLHHSSFSRAASEPQTLVLCAAHTATIPAQNALLKLVEEPPANTQIVLVVRSGQQLLPTLVSRCREILWTASEAAAKNETDVQHLEKMRAFLQDPANYSYHQLVDLAESLKDRQTAQQVLRSLIHQTTGDTLTVEPKLMQNLLSALDSLEKNGNVRLVLEHHLFAIHRLTSE